MGELAGLNEDPGPSAWKRHTAGGRGDQEPLSQTWVHRLGLHLCGLRQKPAFENDISDQSKEVTVLCGHSQGSGTPCPNDGFDSLVNELRTERDRIRLPSRQAFSGRAQSRAALTPRPMSSGLEASAASILPRTHCRDAGCRHLKSVGTKRAGWSPNAI